MSNDPVLIRTDNSVMTITLNRPDALNALSLESHHALDAAFTAYANDDQLTVAVITGMGNKAFCAGSDLKNLAGNKGPVKRHDMPAHGYAGLIERFDLMKPVVAAINGHAIGGGLEIVLSCDIAIAADHAKFGLPEPKVGLASSGGVHRLIRSVGQKDAMKIALCSELFDAQTARSYGLINEVVAPDQLAEATEKTVNALQACSPAALKATKQMMLQGYDAPDLQAAHSQQYSLYEAMLSGPDAQEGMAAFVEKRKPVWRGK
ncbi:hypothetical protein AB833_08460 [Chromatiales bacterium (ex Bugula neritina AB1)]|nr:hypothetical protein AB833_08460 [Chromatiales bacterium (ex Bugula neritina AB1)]